MPYNHRPLRMNLWKYENDGELIEAYQVYLTRFDHDVHVADDLQTWLEYNFVGQGHAERVESAYV